MNLTIKKGFATTIKVKIWLQEGNQRQPYDLTGCKIILEIKSELGKKVVEIQKNQFDTNDKPTEGVAYLHITPEQQPSVGTYIYTLILEQPNGNKLQISKGVLVVI